MYSESALKLYAMKKAGIVKSNAAFWRDHDKIFQAEDFDLRPYARELDESRKWKRFHCNFPPKSHKIVSEKGARGAFFFVSEKILDIF